MCFSPAVSFTTSAALAAIGALSAMKATTRREMLFASIPLFFAGQQLIEGLLWLQLLKSGGTYWLTQSYILFVGVLWPMMVPLSLWLIEPEPQRRKMMLVVLAAGIGVAFFTLHAILQFPVTARIAEYCISYDYPKPQPHFMLALYLIATCTAFFLSSETAIAWLGIVNIGAFATAYYFYRYDLTSVWCFFAALISGLIYLHFDQRAKCEMKLHLAILRR